MSSTQHAPLPTAHRNAPLDGLRGLGTIFVLVGHLGIISRWWPYLAGVLAVSMFFTLSGYLIAGGLLRQIERQGSVGWGRFYAGRARRLLPAATAAVAIVAALWWATGRELPVVTVVSSLTYWRNWELVAAAGSYADVFDEVSPLQHFWSLAIEEQFYLVMPALLVGLLALFARRRGVTAVAVGALALASFLVGAWLDSSDRSRAYYGTDARAGEFLLGVLLALLLAEPGARDRIHRWCAARVAPVFVGVLSVISVVLWWRVGFFTDRLFAYLIPLNAVVTAVQIAYFVSPRPRGFAPWLFSKRPLAELGRRSYSVYLLHWPIYILFDRAGPAQVSDSIVKIAAALIGGFGLFALVEDPVYRRTRWRSANRLAAGLVTVSVVALGSATIAASNAPTRFVDVDAIEAGREEFFDDLPPKVTVPDTGSPDVTRTVQRVLLVGDSNGWTSSFWLKDHPEELPWVFRFWSGTGCGTTGDTLTRARNEPVGVLCPGWLEQLGRAVEAYEPDVVLVVSLAGDLAEHDLGDGVWRSVGDAAYDDFLAGRLRSFVDLVASTGAAVGWFDYPDNAVVDRATGRLGEGPEWGLNDPAKVARVNDMLAEVAADDERVVLVPFRSWAESWPAGQLDRTYRPDGAHLDGNREDVGRWIMARVDDVARSVPTR
jgi:peptidoglycan/LPS O-acetylase OafA/YrhL